MLLNSILQLNETKIEVRLATLHLFLVQNIWELRKFYVRVSGKKGTPKIGRNYLRNIWGFSEITTWQFRWVFLMNLVERPMQRRASEVGFYLLMDVWWRPMLSDFAVSSHFMLLFSYTRFFGRNAKSKSFTAERFSLKVVFCDREQVNLISVLMNTKLNLVLCKKSLKPQTIPIDLLLSFHNVDAVATGLSYSKFLVLCFRLNRTRTIRNFFRFLYI